VIIIKYQLEIPGSIISTKVSDFVYSIIRENIINWNIKPGVIMSEKEVSKQINVSRTPVREAFIKLKRESLVEILPQRGTVVSKIDLKRVEEERFIRECIEVAVLNIAMDNFPSEFLPIIEKNLKSQQECIENIDYKRFIKLDEEFHRVIYSSRKREMCWEVIQTVSSHYKRIRVMTLWDKDILRNLIEQHSAMFDSIRKKDRNKAEFTIKKHLEKLLIEEDEMKRKYPEYFR